MATVCSNSPPPSFVLPLFWDASSSSVGPSPSSVSPLRRVPSAVERRLRALRRMSLESSSSSGSDSADRPPRRRVGSESALDRLSALFQEADGSAGGVGGGLHKDAFTTPRSIHPAPLETPPTPGQRKRHADCRADGGDLPTFLPVGIRAKRSLGAAAAKSSSISLKIPCRRRLSAPTSSSSAPPSPKRLRTAPRYECPWLASFAEAAAKASAEASAAAAKAADGEPKDAEKGDSGAKPSAAADSEQLMNKLQNAARVLEISAHGTSSGNDDGAESDLSDDEEEEGKVVKEGEQGQSSAQQ